MQDIVIKSSTKNFHSSKKKKKKTQTENASEICTAILSHLPVWKDKKASPQENPSKNNKQAVTCLLPAGVVKHLSRL